jgi:CRISPR-associated protein Cas2
VVEKELWMFVIVVYDVNQKRVAKALKTCRRYLEWVQNSVFEGEITRARLESLKADLKKVLELKEDSVLIYRLRTTTYFKKETLGKERKEISNIL